MGKVGGVSIGRARAEAKGTHFNLHVRKSPSTSTFIFFWLSAQLLGQTRLVERLRMQSTRSRASTPATGSAAAA